MNQQERAYPVPAGFTEIEYEVKKSRFIARLYAVESREEAMAHIDTARRDHPAAGHHCWAFVVGQPRSPRAVAQADDGEPTGSAGRPILNVLEHSGTGDILVVVIRYFGGVKLGAGGLARAYGQAAQNALAAAATVEKVPRVDCRFRGDFAHEQPLRRWLTENGGELLAMDYGEGIACDLRIPRRLLEECRSFCLGLGGELVIPE